MQDQASDTERFAQGVVNYNHAAEGVSEDVDGAGRKAVSDLGELVDEAVDVPQVGVIGTVGAVNLAAVDASAVDGYEGFGGC